MKKVLYAVAISALLVSTSEAGNLFAPQNYGSSFNEGFRTMQDSLLQQRQLEQLERDRAYQQEALKLEKQRLEIERQRADLAKTENAGVAPSQEDKEAALYLSNLFDSFPEYNSPESMGELVRAAVFLGNLEANQGKSKAELFQMAHNAIQNKKQRDAFKEFCKVHPEFDDESSKIRKYGDYIYATQFAEEVSHGKKSYAAALKETALAVNEVFPLSSLSAPKRDK